MITVIDFARPELELDACNKINCSLRFIELIKQSLCSNSAYCIHSVENSENLVDGLKDSDEWRSECKSMLRRICVKSVFDISCLRNIYFFSIFIASASVLYLNDDREVVEVFWQCQFISCPSRYGNCSARHYILDFSIRYQHNELPNLQEWLKSHSNHVNCWMLIRVVHFAHINICRHYLWRYVFSTIHQMNDAFISSPKVFSGHTQYTRWLSLCFANTNYSLRMQLTACILNMVKICK